VFWPPKINGGILTQNFTPQTSTPTQKLDPMLIDDECNSLIFLFIRAITCYVASVEKLCVLELLKTTSCGTMMQTQNKFWVCDVLLILVRA